MFRFCANIALVRRRQRTIAITFLARIKRSPVGTEIKPAAEKQPVSFLLFMTIAHSSSHANEDFQSIFLLAIGTRDSKSRQRKSIPRSVLTLRRKKEFGFSSFFS
jgi:hypothetical protein